MEGLYDRTRWHRPILMGKNVMVSSGHHLASMAGIDILKKGGNAIDAGIAVGLCINVVQPDMTNFGGVAPIMLYSSDEDKVFNISGLGTWPKSVSIEKIKEKGGFSREAFTSSVVPSAPDAWLTALDKFGTLHFSDIVEKPLQLAENGFPAHPFFINNIIKRDHKEYEYTRSLFYPNGKTPRIGDPIIQKDLAKTFKRLIKIEDQNRHLGRHEALMAVRNEFYTGKIAEETVNYVQKHGGFLSLEDMAQFHVGLEDPIKSTFRDVEVYSCGPWCQGPVNPIILNILEGFELKSMEHMSAEYTHILASSIDLAFSDLYHYVGDPRFVDVPIKELISKKYADTRRELIDENKTWGKMPPPGDPRKNKAILEDWEEPNVVKQTGWRSVFQDTSYGCVVDKERNAFSATPSDGGYIIPGLGFVVSPRGSQSWLDPDHPSSVQPGKRPRLTPNPMLAFRDGELFMAYGSPGSEVQPQTQTAVLVNIIDFKMNVQEAIEAPRIRDGNFPSAAHPHVYEPGHLGIESRVGQENIIKLRKMGYKVKVYPEFTERCGGASAILVDSKRGLLMGGADPRRENYAIGY